MHSRGQTAVEVLGVAVIITTLLLFVFLYVQQRNAETLTISETSKNLIQCNAISETIANLYNNRATSEQVLLIERAATIRKQTGVGAVFVDSISCSYIGSVENEETGVSLSASTQYRFRKEDGEVTVCEVGAC